LLPGFLAVLAASTGDVARLTLFLSGRSAFSFFAFFPMRAKLGAIL